MLLLLSLPSFPCIQIRQTLQPSETRVLTLGPVTRLIFAHGSITSLDMMQIIILTLSALCRKSRPALARGTQLQQLPAEGRLLQGRKDRQFDTSIFPLPKTISERIGAVNFRLLELPSLFASPSSALVFLTQLQFSFFFGQASSEAKGKSASGSHILCPFLRPSSPSWWTCFPFYYYHFEHLGQYFCVVRAKNICSSILYDVQQPLRVKYSF